MHGFNFLCVGEFSENKTSLVAVYESMACHINANYYTINALAFVGKVDFTYCLMFRIAKPFNWKNTRN